MRRGSRSPTRIWKRCASSETSSRASGTTRYSRPRSNTPKWKTYFGTAPLPVGDRAANLRQAIAYYEQALRFRTPEADPRVYAMTQNNLGNAYRELPVGDRAANLQQAI